MICWNQPNTVPKCVTSSLQDFNWSGYLGTPHDKDLAVYILKNACRLETATIFYDHSYTSKYEMLKELSLSSRASSTCQLVFDEFSSYLSDAFETIREYFTVDQKKKKRIL